MSGRNIVFASIIVFSVLMMIASFNLNMVKSMYLPIFSSAVILILFVIMGIRDYLQERSRESANENYSDNDGGEESGHWKNFWKMLADIMWPYNMNLLTTPKNFCLKGGESYSWPSCLSKSAAKATN